MSIQLEKELNDMQCKAASIINGPVLIIAGAGSGKTRMITFRIAHMLEQGIPQSAILALTFTNKAAREMTARVESLNVPSGAMLCTFHSLCARLLREFADRAGIEPNYTIYDRDDQVRLTKEAIAVAGLPVANFPPARVHASIGRAKNRLRTPVAYADEA